MPKLLIENPAQPAGAQLGSPASFGATQAVAMQNTGRVAQALGQVLQEHAKVNAKTRAIQFEKELEAEAAKISMDPDIQSRNSQFRKAQKRLLETYRPKHFSRADYDRESSISARRIASQFQMKTMEDSTYEMRLEVKLEITSMMMKAAKSEDDAEIAALFEEARVALSDANLFMTPNQQTEALQEAIGEGIRAMSDLQPERALKWIERLGSVLGSEVTSVYRGEALTTIRQNAAAEAAKAREDRTSRINAENDASRAAEERLMEIERSGGLTLDAVRAQQGLSSSAYARWKRLATGGAKSSGSDAQTYIELSDLANAGEDVVEEANEALTSGRISRTERDSIVKTSREGRFSEPRKSILGTLKKIEEFQPTKRSGAVLGGLSEFDEWTRENPGATRTQADQKARELIDTWSKFKQPDSVPKPTANGARPLDSKEAIASELRSLDQRRKMNLIPQSEYDQRRSELFEASKDLITNSQGGAAK